LLSILASDTAIYEDKDVSGYGLNFSWRSLGGEPGRVTVERAVVYLPKDRVRAFSRRELTQNHLLAEAVIFAGQESGPMNLVSYRAQNSQPDFRPAIQDETLAVTAVERQDPRPQAKERKAALVKDNNKPAPDTPAAPAPPSASEKKPPVSKPASAAVSESGALAVKPPAKMAAEAQVTSAVRSQPQPSKAPQPTAYPVPGIVDAKPLEGQTAAAPSKPVPGAQPNKTEPVSAMSKKPPTEPFVASAAPPAQREKISEVNVKREKAVSASQPIEGGGTKTAIKAEAAEKIAQTDVPRPQMPLAAAKAASEQIALVQKKPAETAADSKTAPGSRTALLGYVIQVVFEDKSDAQRWAETITRRGHAVSLTETGGASFRLRLGNFLLREEAERQLRALKEEGLTGIILNLPQAYHPDTGKTATIVKPADAVPAGH
jgi:hypothetical protein